MPTEQQLIDDFRAAIKDFSNTFPPPQDRIRVQDGKLSVGTSVKIGVFEGDAEFVMVRIDDNSYSLFTIFTIFYTLKGKDHFIADDTTFISKYYFDGGWTHPIIYEIDVENKVYSSPTIFYSDERTHNERE